MDFCTSELLDSIPMACCLLDGNYQVVNCNQSMLELFALRPGQPFVNLHPYGNEPLECDANCQACPFLGQDECIARKTLIRMSRHTIPGYENHPDFVEKIIEKSFEFAVKNKSVTHITLWGEEIPCEATAAPLKGGYAYYIRDLREQYVVKDEVKRREAAEEESLAKTRFLTHMSHEMRTPMNAIIGLTEIQVRDGGHTPEVEDIFNRIYASSSILLAIINDILDLSKVEVGKMTINPTDYDTASLIMDTVQINLVRVGEKPIDFYLRVDENVPARMEGDDVRIKQILNNLISNAFKYTNKGGVWLDISTETASDKQVILNISVKDSGQGMSQDQVDNLGNLEFTRFNEQNNRSIEGTGLGMHITYQMLKLMNGEIEVKSEQGKGTTFFVRIPQGLVNNAVIGKKTAENLQRLETAQWALKRMNKLDVTFMPNGRVLVVDDVESNLHVAKGMLRPYKLTIDLVKSGNASIERIKEGNVYDIIFMDYLMPEMDGVEAVRIIRQLGYDRPIIALTANAIEGQATMLMQSGFNGFMSKPIDVHQLNSYLMRFIKDIHPQDSQSAQHTDEASDNKKVIEAFLRDGKRSAADLLALCESDFQNDPDLGSYTISIHGIKSALINADEPILSDLAGVLELAGFKKDFSTVKRITPAFVSRLMDVLDKHTLKNTNENNDYVIDDTGFLLDHLLLLQSACKTYNKKAMRTVIDTLEKRPASKQIKDFIDNVKAHLLHADFDDAALLTSSIIKKIAATEVAHKERDRPTVLIIDDSPLVISTLTKIISSHYNIRSASDGKTGLSIAKKEDIKLILLDIKMPGISGFDVLKEIKESEKLKDMPVIFITASDDAEDEALGFYLGAVDYIRKPFVSDHVMHRVKLHLSGGSVSKKDSDD